MQYVATALLAFIVGGLFEKFFGPKLTTDIAADVKSILAKVSAKL